MGKIIIGKLRTANGVPIRTKGNSQKLSRGCSRKKKNRHAMHQKANIKEKIPKKTVLQLIQI